MVISPIFFYFNNILGFKASTIINYEDGCFTKEINFPDETEEEAPQKKKVVGTRQKKAKEIVVQKDQSKITTFFNKNENKST